MIITARIVKRKLISNLQEILPSELAEDASTAFSEAVLPYVEAFVSEQKGADGLRAQLDMAMICQEGNLLPAHAGLQPLLGVDGPVVVADAPRKVILFGSGSVIFMKMTRETISHVLSTVSQDGGSASD